MREKDPPFVAPIGLTLGLLIREGPLGLVDLGAVQMAVFRLLPRTNPKRKQKKRRERVQMEDMECLS